jgi:hypothetical protein
MKGDPMLDVHTRYGYHEPTDQQKQKLHYLAGDYQCFVQQLEMSLPDGRCKGIGLRKLEEALAWHREAILRAGRDHSYRTDPLTPCYGCGKTHAPTENCPGTLHRPETCPGCDIHADWRARR